MPKADKPYLRPCGLLRGVVLAAAASGLLGQDVVTLDEIVAKINSDIITLTDLQKELKVLRAELSAEFRDPAVLEKEFQTRKKPLLRTMIETKLMIQKAEELSMTGDVDAQVAANLEETRKQAGIPNMEVFDQVLHQYGSSLAERREWLKRRFIVDMVVEQFVYSKLTLLTPEIEAFYNENIQRFTEPAEVELAEILLLTEGKQKAQVRQRAEAVLARLKAGASFEEEAKQSSEGPTASRGGVIGAFKKGSMAPALENVVFDLNEGQISNLVETDYGFQIVKLLRKKPPVSKPLAEVRPFIQRELYMRKAEPEMKEFMESLRSQSFVYIGPNYRSEYDVEGL